MARAFTHSGLSPSDEIRRAPCAGIGIGEPNPAANSRTEVRAEKPTPGAATDDTLSALVPLVSGGVIRFSAVHGRVDMQIRLGKGRSWQTTPVTAERAEYFAQRLAEIAQHARAQRQAKGA